MAQIYSKLSGKESPGLEALYNQFALLLPDEYHLWHSLKTGSEAGAVDLLLLHPEFGLWVFKICDWKAEQIKTLDAHHVSIEDAGRISRYPNPVYQALQNYFWLKQLLSAEETFRKPTKYDPEALSIPLHHQAVFSAITEAEMIEKKLFRVFSPDHVITADLLEEAADDYATLENLLLDKRTPGTHESDQTVALDDDQIRLLKETIYPENTKTIRYSPPRSKRKPLAQQKTEPEAEAKSTETMEEARLASPRKRRTPPAAAKKIDEETTVEPTESLELEFDPETLPPLQEEDAPEPAGPAEEIESTPDENIENEAESTPAEPAETVAAETKVAPSPPPDDETGSPETAAPVREGDTNPAPMEPAQEEAEQRQGQEEDYAPEAAAEVPAETPEDTDAASGEPILKTDRQEPEKQLDVSSLPLSEETDDLAEAPVQDTVVEQQPPEPESMPPLHTGEGESRQFSNSASDSAEVEEPPRQIEAEEVEEDSPVAQPPDLSVAHLRSLEVIITLNNRLLKRMWERTV